MPRRAPGWAPLVIALAAVTLARATAWADRVGLQGQLSGDVAWTDNVMNAPSNAPAALMLRPPVSDFFFELRPGLLLSSAAPRAVTRTEYFFQADLFATHPEGNSYSNTLSWQGFFLPSPRSELLFSVLGQQGRLNTFNLNEPSVGSPVTVVNAAAASTSFAQATASEVLLYHLPQAWNVTQTVIARLWFDLQPGQLPNVYETIATGGADHRWKVDALGFNLNTDYVYYDQVRDPRTNVVTAQPQQQLLNRLMLRYRRDLNSFWSTELDAGIVEASTLGGSGNIIVQPAGIAALRYNNLRGSGELAYQHMTEPNAVAASTFAMDEVALRGTLPFPQRSRMYLSATAAYQHARQIDFDTGLTLTTAEVVVVDATLRWQPRPEVGVFARYSLFDQFGHAPSEPELVSQGQLSIRRTVVMVGINVLYPGVPVSRVPNRQSVTQGRVDRADVDMIPEPHSPVEPKQ